MADLTNLKPGDRVEVVVQLTIGEIEHVTETTSSSFGDAVGPFTAITFAEREGWKPMFTMELPTTGDLVEVTVTEA